MFGNMVGLVLGIKLVNGKIKPKYGVVGMFMSLFFPLCALFFLGLLIYGIINLNFKMIFYFTLGLIAIIYLMLINPYFQNSNHYYIQFESENSLNNFELYYKKKKVNIQYRIDQQGKIAFLNNAKKTTCISYADGSTMNKITKFKIVNYFTKWLSDNNLLSKEVTNSLE